MSEEPTDERLGDKRYITLVLRLVVDAAGKLMHGEIGDLNGMTRGRFARLDKLAVSVQEVVSDHDRQGLRLTEQ